MSTGLKNQFKKIVAETDEVKKLLDAAFIENPNSKECVSYNKQWHELLKQQKEFRENYPRFFLNNFENNIV